MREYMDIGSSPCDEDCVQLGSPNYETLARAECERFKELIRKVCGEPPAGARLIVKSNDHDFGVYLEVGVSYIDGDPIGEDYAIHCQNDAPHRWDGSGGKKWTVPVLTNED